MTEPKHTCVVLSLEKAGSISVYLVDVVCGAIQWEISSGHESVQAATLSLIKDHPLHETMVVDLTGIGSPVTKLGHKKVVELIEGFDANGVFHF